MGAPEVMKDFQKEVVGNSLVRDADKSFRAPLSLSNILKLHFKTQFHKAMSIHVCQPQSKSKQRERVKVAGGSILYCTPLFPALKGLI